MTYLDEGECWLRIRHEHGLVSASLTVDCMISLLTFPRKIELDEKKSDVKTLTFTPSGRLYSENYYMDTLLNSARVGKLEIGYKQDLLDMLSDIPEWNHA